MRKLIFLVTLLLLLMTVAGAGAQDASELAFAAVQDGHLILFGLGDTPLVVDNRPNRGIYNLAWSPDGSTLAYILNDEQFQAHVMALNVDSGAEPVRLDTGALVAGFPLSFTPDGQLLYIGQSTAAPDAGLAQRVEVRRITPAAGAQPETLGSFAFAAGCGGGSSIPADWRYWEETAFGGNHLILEWTDSGLLHSASCGGETAGLLNLATGEDRPIGPVLTSNVPPDGLVGRLALSPDKTMLAGLRQVITDQSITRSLVLIDIATGTVTDLAANGQPEHVAWGLDGTLFYSTREAGRDLLEWLNQEQMTRINTAFGFEQTSLPAYTVSVRHLNLASGNDIQLYSADAYAVGRMIPSPDGQRLFISLVSNLDAWVQAIVGGGLDPIADNNGSGARAMVPVSVYRVPLLTREAPILIGDNLAQFTPRPSRQ